MSSVGTEHIIAVDFKDEVKIREEVTSRMYWFEIEGRTGWKTRYVKTVNYEEVTLSYRQEIYNEMGILVEVHEKYPIDKGHKK